MGHDACGEVPTVEAAVDVASGKVGSRLRNGFGVSLNGPVLLCLLKGEPGITRLFRPGKRVTLTPVTCSPGNNVSVRTFIPRRYSVLNGRFTGPAVYIAGGFGQFASRNLVKLNFLRQRVMTFSFSGGCLCVGR